MRSRQVIDTTSYDGEVIADRGALIIRGVRVPLEEVAVLMIGEQTVLSGKCISLLAKYDVILLNCNWKGIPNLVGLSWSNNSRVALRHRKQAELSGPRKKQAWKQIVQAKIHGQERNLLFTNNPASKQLKRLRQEVRSGDPSNCEAQAARIYWDTFFDVEEFRRVPGANDRINGLLNYGYTIMRGFVIQAICAAGIWPTYGIWHRNRSNTFALADDLIEPFRPALDLCVYHLHKDASLEEREVKRTLVGITSAVFDDTGATMVTKINDLASSLALFIEGTKEALDVPIWSPTYFDAGVVSGG